MSCFLRNLRNAPFSTSLFSLCHVLFSPRSYVTGCEFSRSCGKQSTAAHGLARHHQRSPSSHDCTGTITFRTEGVATIASCPFLPLDGWRAQVHIEAGAATLYSNNGADITRRFRSLRPALARVPVRSAIIDCELVACDETGMPSFRSLMNLGNKAPALCLWCFDLLSLDGARITPLPLVERRALLGKIVTAASTRHLQFSGEFDDPVALLDTCQRMNSISKRKNSAYRPGPTGTGTVPGFYPYCRHHRLLTLPTILRLMFSPLLARRALWHPSVREQRAPGYFQHVPGR